MTKKQIEKMLYELARKHFVCIETFEERKNDNLDFHEVPVWAIKNSIREAFELGRKTKLMSEKK
jgi:hypothetical protein